MTTRSAALLAMITCMGVTLLAPCVAAQEAPLPGNQEVPTPGNNLATSAGVSHSKLAALLDGLTQRHQVQIVFDPELELPAEITIPDKRLPLKDALDQVTRQIKNAAWQCVSLKPSANLPSPEKLSAVIRAISRLPQTEMVVENSPKERGTLLLSLPPFQTRDAQAEVDLRDAKHVYVLYNTSLPTDGNTAAERMAEMQRQQLQLLAQLPPEQRPNPALLGQRVLQSLGNGGQEAALHRVGEAGMKAWQNTAPDARDEMMQQFIKTVQNTQPPKPNTGVTPETGAKAPQNHIKMLSAIAETLAKRYHVRIIIDPDLYVSVPLLRPAEDITLDQALDVLTKSVSGSAWRSIYQKPPTASSVSLPARSLSAVARTLQILPSDLLRLENLPSQRSVTVQIDFANMRLPSILAAHALSARPTYLIYATQERTKSSLPVKQHVEQMQLQQMEQLLKLSSSQMTQVITDALAQYSGGTTDAQSQMMGLPIMALLMGSWFPQKAQEDKSTLPPGGNVEH